MTTPVFSINGAAELLERDRRTVQKSLRHVQPDKKERGQPRWRLRTILDALDRLPSSNTPRRHYSHDDNNDAQEYAARVFNVGACYARANDALLALDEMPDDKDFRIKAFGDVFDKIEALRAAFERAEPKGQSEATRYLIGRMISGLMYACQIQITDDDGTPFIPNLEAYTPPAGSI